MYDVLEETSLRLTDESHYVKQLAHNGIDLSLPSGPIDSNHRHKQYIGPFMIILRDWFVLYRILGLEQVLGVTRTNQDC